MESGDSNVIGVVLMPVLGVGVATHTSTEYVKRTQGRVIEGVVGDLGKEIVMPDSIKWQSGVGRYFKEYVNKENTTELNVVISWLVPDVL